MALIDLLPVEVLLMVLENCDNKTRISAGQVSTGWRNAARRHHSLWNDIDLSLPEVPIQDIAPVLKRLVGYSFPLPLSVFADAANMSWEHLRTTYASMAQMKLPLSIFKRLVTIEPSIYLSNHFVGTNAALAVDPDLSPEVANQGMLLSVAWIHYTENEGRAHDLVPLDEEGCLTELEPTLKRAGVVNQHEWLILHTRLNASTGRYRSIAIANWSHLTRLTLTLPGTYQYLPILAQTSNLTTVTLSFPSGCPPIQPGDDPLRKLQPFGYQPHRRIRLPYLQGLSLYFHGDSFHFPASWNFLDSLGGCVNLMQFVFHTDHFTKYDSQMKMNLLAVQLGISDSGISAPGVSRRHAYYDPLYNFLRHAGQNLMCLHSVLGPGLDIRSLLDSIGHERIVCLVLSSICWDPRETVYDLQCTTSQLLNTIAQGGFPNLKDLSLGYPISSVQDLEAIHQFHPSRSPVLKWFKFAAVNSDLTICRAKGMLDGQRTGAGCPWMNLRDFIRFDERPYLPLSFKGVVSRPALCLTYGRPPDGYVGPGNFADWSLDRVNDYVVHLDSFT